MLTKFMIFKIKSEGRIRTKHITSSSATAGPGEEASRLGPGASIGGAGGLSNSGDGAGAGNDLCFLVLDFFLDLLGVGVGTSAVGAATGAGGELVDGAGASGDFSGGELTGTGAGGELVGT